MTGSLSHMTRRQLLGAATAPWLLPVTVYSRAASAEVASASAWPTFQAAAAALSSLGGAIEAENMRRFQQQAGDQLRLISERARETLNEMIALRVYFPLQLREAFISDAVVTLGALCNRILHILYLHDGSSPLEGEHRQTLIGHLEQLIVTTYRIITYDSYASAASMLQAYTLAFAAMTALRTRVSEAFRFHVRLTEDFHRAIEGPRGLVHRYSNLSKARQLHIALLVSTEVEIGRVPEEGFLGGIAWGSANNQDRAPRRGVGAGVLGSVGCAVRLPRRAG